jgi:hypothetical protein
MRSTASLRTPGLARVGQVAFWFFLAKGLLWLSLPIAAGLFGWQWGGS